MIFASSVIEFLVVGGIAMGTALYVNNVNKNDAS